MSFVGTCTLMDIYIVKSYYMAMIRDIAPITNKYMWKIKTLLKIKVFFVIPS